MNRFTKKQAIPQIQKRKRHYWQRLRKATCYRSRAVWRQHVAVTRFSDAMVVAFFLYGKECVLEILQCLDYKGCLLDKYYCCHPEGLGPVWFPFCRSLEELSATIPWPCRMCVRKFSLYHFFLLTGMRRLVSRPKVKLGQ